MFDLGFPLFGVATLIAVLAASRYLLGPETFAAWVKALTSAVSWGYSEAKDIVGTVSRRGWRPLIPWTLIAMGGGIAYRLTFGLPLPNVAEILGVVAPFVLPTLMGQWTRSQETLQGVANGAPTSAPIEGRTGPDNLTFSAA